MNLLFLMQLKEHFYINNDAAKVHYETLFLDPISEKFIVNVAVIFF